jgi:hypothetical protein
MTAARSPFDLGGSYGVSQTSGRRFALAPAEGWTSVLLLVLMCALVGWAIDDARWVLGDQANTDFLPWAGALGVLWGLAAAKLGRGRLVAHGVGALLATAFLVLAVGSRLGPAEDLAGMIRVTAEGVWEAYDDLVLRGRATTTEIAHYLLVLGGLAWANGQFAAYTAYAHRRPLSAVVLPGTILVVNVSITVLDQFVVLVLYALAALVFLVRFHVADEQRTWARHRIADVGNAVGLSLRAGLTLVGFVRGAYNLRGPLGRGGRVPAGQVSWLVVVLLTAPSRRRLLGSGRAPRPSGRACGFRRTHSCGAAIDLHDLPCARPDLSSGSTESFLRIFSAPLRGGPQVRNRVTRGAPLSGLRSTSTRLSYTSRRRRSPITSAGGPSALTLPPDSTTRRSQNSAARLRSWLTATTHILFSRASRSSSAWIST